MPPEVNSGINTAPESNISTLSSDQDIFRLDKQDFHNPTAWLKNHIRPEVLAVVEKIRGDVYKRNGILLRAANINVHDTDHQDRVAQIVYLLFQAFRDKLKEANLEPVIVAAMTHDSEYIPAARQFASQQIQTIDRTATSNSQGTTNNMRICLEENRVRWQTFLNELTLLEKAPIETLDGLWQDKSFPTLLDKKALDPHAELGSERMVRNYDNPEFAHLFGSWNAEQRRTAEIAIRDHSNGSTYNPLGSDIAAHALRLGDKLDNVRRRITPSMLSLHSLQDRLRYHHFVPACIKNQEILIDRSSSTFRVLYYVDTEYLQREMRRHTPSFSYSKNDFLNDFQQAYGATSMPRAAEVHARMVAQEGECYSPDAKFEVQFVFPDAETETLSYEPLPTEPVYH